MTLASETHFGQSAKSLMTHTLNPYLFREYDIRGHAQIDLSEKATRAIARAFAQMLRQRGLLHVVVGRDCRLSSPSLFTWLTDELLAGGINVSDLGEVPTPAMYFATLMHESGTGIMITGSHNPAPDNGFKIVMQRESFFGEDLQKLRGVALEALEQASSEGPRGTLSLLPLLPSYHDWIVRRIQHARSSRRILLDCGNGMAGVVAPRLYRALGYEVETLYEIPDGRFPHHHPDPTVAANLTVLQDQCRRKHVVGLAFDGDADRLAVVDPLGGILSGEELLWIFARSILKKKRGAIILGDVKVSKEIFAAISRAGGVPYISKTGHSLIKSKMKELQAPLAGEMSGHLFFADRYFGYDDAIYAGARLLEILEEEHVESPTPLIADLPQRHTTAEIRIPCLDDDKRRVVQSVHDELERLGCVINALDGVRVEFDDGWGLLRASNTQPALVSRYEARTYERLVEIEALFQGALEKAQPHVPTQTVETPKTW